jgi:DNA primase large subunit
VETLNLDWETVSNEERAMYAPQLQAAGGGFPKNIEEESFFKVDWERVPELVENRKVFLKAGKAYVPGRDQSSMVAAEFTSQLDKALLVCCPTFIEIMRANVSSLLPVHYPVLTKMID